MDTHTTVTCYYIPYYMYCCVAYTCALLIMLCTLSCCPVSHHYPVHLLEILHLLAILFLYLTMG